MVSTAQIDGAEHMVMCNLVGRNSHCDVLDLHITPSRVARLFLDCNGDFAIKAYIGRYRDVWIAALQDVAAQQMNL